MRSAGHTWIDNRIIIELVADITNKAKFSFIATIGTRNGLVFNDQFFMIKERPDEFILSALKDKSINGFHGRGRIHRIAELSRSRAKP